MVILTSMKASVRTAAVKHTVVFTLVQLSVTVDSLIFPSLRKMS